MIEAEGLSPAGAVACLARGSDKLLFGAARRAGIAGAGAAGLGFGPRKQQRDHVGLVGNPPGALNNRITVLLRDPGGGVVDSLIDVDGNATGASDEALYRPWTGDRFLDDPILGPITPLGFPPAVRPVPEPATLVMVCVSGFSAALASVRRVRCARRRKRHAGPRSPTPTI